MPKMHCVQCHHFWDTRTPRRPRQCPKCWTVDWDRNPKYRYYNFANIEVGKTVLYPWFENQNKNERIIRALLQYMRRSERKFKYYPTGLGLNVTRVS